MKETYKEAITQVFKDEGGYSNDSADPGGPTNWGITIKDAQMYWKADATAEDVRNMPKSVAEDIYAKHYAEPLKFNELPAGVDYAVLDYGINSGIGRVRKVYAKVTKETLDPKEIINKIYDEREAFLKGLKTFPTFGKGWLRRTSNGRRLALNLWSKYGLGKTPVSGHVATGTIIVAGGAVASQAPSHLIPWIIGGALLVALVTWFIIKKG